MRDRGMLSRRTFLKRSALAPLAGAVVTGAMPRSAAAAGLRAEEPVNVAIIGFGVWGREIAATIARLPELKVTAVVDTYDVMLRRADRAVPDASTHTDYREVLDNPAIQSVIIATPTHLHRQIAVDALAAGKHVYVEAPMAHTIDDARAMAQAARDASKQIFQVGLLYRSNPQYRSVFQFIRSGALGQATMARAQWHSKESWRRASPNQEREREQNWRLDEAVSLGLVGEVGIQQLDPAMWFLGGRPTSVTGFGQIMLWNDGRTLPDTIQAIYRFPGGLSMIYDATLTSSFDDAYEMYYGRDSTIMMRDSKAWMFKEVDAPMVGWEVYARKDTFYREKGITLAANATKLDAQNVDPAADDPNVESPLWYALKEFTDNHFFGPYPPAAGYQEGFDATVIAVRSTEAIRGNTTVQLDESAFAI
ncbi:MAG TPA: Gfo/Idh/MocA family oxidoreductase [Rhodothermales bacterium]